MGLKVTESEGRNDLTLAAGAGGGGGVGEGIGSHGRSAIPSREVKHRTGHRSLKSTPEGRSQIRIWDLAASRSS